MVNQVKKYQKLTQREHILLRPDTYIGSVHNEEGEMYILDEQESKILLKNITYNPGLYKIYDEIIVNAIDHVTRMMNEKNKDNRVSKIDVEIQDNIISIKNNGRSIPIEIHPEYKVYIPDLVFGELLTSENYDDTEERITGGKNGLGSTCTNIYSKTFTVEVGNNGKKFKRTYSDNMTIKSKEKITTYAGKDYVKITFEPDYKRFGIEGLSPDMLNLFKKRVYDISACTPKDVKVTFNKEVIKVKTFEDYVDMYLGTETKKIYKQFNDRWEIVVCGGTNDKFQHVSFVNGICTYQGGKHIDYISQQLMDGLYPILIKKNKELNIKKQFIKNYLFVFVKCNIVNPDFQGQTKEMLKTNKSKFGSTCELDKQFLDKVSKLSVMDEIIRFAEFKEEKDLKKQDGKKKNKVNVPNYDGAIYAGQKNKSHLCTLILTEGLSAKGMAMNGLSALDKEQRKYWGNFPMKGKILNVRDCSINKLSANEEINNLKLILGLEHKKEYKNLDELRYGKIMMMGDADEDASHIRSLLFNIFAVLWPSLFKFPNFLESFLTPIVKAKKGKEEKAFYSLEKFKKWYQTNKNWKIKYYKGLGTSTKEEAKEYFKNLDKNRIKFHYVPEADKSFDLAFNKKRTDDRKEWLMKYNPNVDIDYTNSVSLDDLIHKNLIHFSIDDLSRSIPNIMDGLKISQRKVLFTCFKRNITNEIKVAQLAGSVSELSGYHHGEKSLEDCIVGMAQNFVGSNNINLLAPQGNFGGRAYSGKDAAASRYIFTHLTQNALKIFDKKDLPLLNYLEDDGMIVEPSFYVPTIPMVLINGAQGIGTGFSTFIPSYNPDDIKQNISRLLKGQELKEMIPWYQGFKGSIEKVVGDDYRYETKGIYTIEGKKVIISEIPIGESITNYKEKLQKMDLHVDNLSDGDKVHLEFKADPQFLKQIEKDPYTTLKLKSTLNTSNMHLFNAKGQVQKYNTTLDILKEYFVIRLVFYQKRKEYLLKQWNEEIQYMMAKINFIKAVNLKKIHMRKQTEKDVEDYLKQEEFPKKENSFNYLLNLPMRMMTKEQMDKLQNEIDKVNQDINLLQNKTNKELWLDDLV